MVTTSVPFKVQSIENEPLFHRWLAMASRTLPDAPQTLLRLCYAGDGFPAASLIAQTIHCSPDDAEAWEVRLAACLVSPDAYAEVCEAEDRMADYRQRRSTFQQRMHDMHTRVKDLDAEMAALDKLGDVPGRRDAINAELQPLRDERRELLTSLEREIPQQVESYKQEGEEVRRQLAEAQQQYHEAEQAELRAVFEQRMREALPLVEPLVRQLELLRHVDERATQVGLDPREMGSARLLEAYVQRLRRTVAPPQQSVDDLVRSLPPAPRLP